MILPIGHESSETRRLPWVTATVIVLCFAAWFHTLYAYQSLPVLPPDHYRDAAQAFWLEHPYLEPDGRLAVFMIRQEEPDAFPHEDPTREDWELWLTNKRLASQTPVATDGEELEELQHELDRRTAFGFYLEPDQIPPEGEIPAKRFGLIPAEHTWYTFVTHVFMHASWGHILGNLFLFFLMAPALEDRWGRPLFASFYLVSGVLAGAFHMLLELGSPIPLVGASGAISGVMGAFLVLFWKTRIRFLYFFLFLPPIWGTFHVAAWVALPVWFANEMLNAWIMQTTGASGGVAYWAHVGGFLVGSAFAMTVKGFRLEERFLHSAIEHKITLSQGKAAVEQARRAIEEGVFEEAFLLMQQESQNRPDDRDVALGFWEASVAFFRPGEAMAPLASWIERCQARDPVVAADTWAEAVDISPAFQLGPPSLVKIAESFLKRKDEKRAAQALQYVLSDENPGLGAGMALRARQLAQGLDPAVELRALERVLSVAQLPDAKRERLEAECASLRERGVEPAADPLVEERRKHDRGCDETGALELDVDEGTAAWQEPRQLVADRAARAAALAGDQPLGLDETGPLGLAEAEPLGLDESEPLGLAESEPLGLAETEPLGLAESEPVGLAETEPVGLAETEPVGLAETEPVGLDQTEPLALDDGAAPLALDDAGESIPLDDGGGSIGLDRGAGSIALDDGAGSIALGDDADLEDDICFGDDELALGGESLPRFVDTKVLAAVPEGLEGDNVVLRTGDGRGAKLPLERIQAVAVAAVGGLAPKPVLVIDFLLNWNDVDAQCLRLIRMRSDGFDPSKLAPDAGNAVQAIRVFLSDLRSRATAEPLPDTNAAVGSPFARFDDLQSYQREVLMVDG